MPQLYSHRAQAHWQINASTELHVIVSIAMSVCSWNKSLLLERILGCIGIFAINFTVLNLDLLGTATLETKLNIMTEKTLFLKVTTIGFRSEINPPMLRTWLLGKEKLFVRDGHACVAQLVYDGPGSYQTNHSRCTITTCSTKLIGPVQSAFITQGFNWQFDCFLLIWKRRWMHILIDFVHGLTSFRLLRHAR